MRKYIFILLALLPASLFAQNEVGSDGNAGDNDFGIWFEAGATKKLSKQWSLGVETELRLADNVRQVSRFTLGGTVDFKPLNWLRLSTGYSWIYGHTFEKRKNTWDEDDPQTLKNYKITPGYWHSKHRIKVEAAFQFPKLWNCIRISLRERYQYTWRSEFTTDRWKYRVFKHDTSIGGVDYKKGDLKPSTPDDPNPSLDPKVNECESTHYLRSRVKVQLDKKRCPWSPFVSYELYNDLGSGFRVGKTRLSAGTGYSITKQHEVGLAYIFSTEYDDVTDHAHIISLSYGFKF